MTTRALNLSPPRMILLQYLQVTQRGLFKIAKGGSWFPPGMTGQSGKGQSGRGGARALSTSAAVAAAAGQEEYREVQSSGKWGT